MDIISKTAKISRVGTVKPIGKLCMRAKETDESSTLLAAERMALGLNAKEILFYFSYVFAEYQLCHLHHNHYTERQCSP